MYTCTLKVGIIVHCNFMNWVGKALLTYTYHSQENFSWLEMFCSSLRLGTQIQITQILNCNCKLVIEGYQSLCQRILFTTESFHCIIFHHFYRKRTCMCKANNTTNEMHNSDCLRQYMYMEQNPQVWYSFLYFLTTKSDGKIGLSTTLCATAVCLTHGIHILDKQVEILKTRKLLV